MNRAYLNDIDPPLALKILVAIDNALYQKGIENKTELGGAIFELYRFLAVGLIEANGRTGETMLPGEKESAQAYLGMMKNYIEDHTEKHHTDIILDYGKNREQKDSSGEGVLTPEKNADTAGSVKAPKKKR